MSAKIIFMPSQIDLVGYQQVKVILKSDNKSVTDLTCKFNYSSDFISISNVNSPLSTLKINKGSNYILLSGQFASNTDWSKDQTILTFYMNPLKNGDTKIFTTDCNIVVNQKNIRLRANPLRIRINSIVGANPSAVSVSDSPQITQIYTPQVYMKGAEVQTVTRKQTSAKDWLTFIVLLLVLIGIGVWFFKWQKSTDKS